jgi:hypothetical protein
LEYISGIPLTITTDVKNKPPQNALATDAAFRYVSSRSEISWITDALSHRAAKSAEN